MKKWMNVRSLLLIISFVVLLAGSGTNAEAAVATPAAGTAEGSTENSSETEEAPGLGNTEIKMYQGTILPLEIRNLLPESRVSWQVSDPEVIAVDTEGNITALKEGTAQITVTIVQKDQTYELTASVTVSGFSGTKIQLEQNKTVLKTGEQFAIPWKLIPADATDVIQFTSDHPEVALVDEKGIITGLKAGKAVITVSLTNGQSTEFLVTIVSGLKSIQVLYIEKNSFTLGVRQSRVLHYKSEPSAVRVIWSSSNNKVAAVDQNGKVTGKKAGKAKITLEAEDGSGIKTVLTVTVKDRGKKASYTEAGLSIVDISKAKYTYEEMAGDLKQFEKKYGDFLSVTVRNTSYDNRNIYEVLLGNPNAKKHIIVQASIHGREYMATQLAMRQIELYCRNYYTGMYGNRYYSEIFDETVFHIIPMANPDGVTISQFGAKSIKNKTLRTKLEQMCKKYGNGKASYYTGWKANARGVDLNRNFDAYWELLDNGAKSPRSSHYKGTGAVSEREADTLVKLVNQVKPVSTISYHAYGSILYWNYGQKGALKKESLQLVNTVKAMTGYQLITSFSKNNSAGFSDWVSMKKKLPAVTIEIGTQSCPLSISQFKSIWNKNKLLYVAVADLY